MLRTCSKIRRGILGKTLCDGSYVDKMAVNLNFNDSDDDEMSESNATYDK